MNYNKSLKFVRVIIVLLALFFILVLISKDFAWLGKLEFKTDFTKFTPFISILKPQERVKVENMAYIQEEPVYFDLYLPRDFDRAVLEFNYNNDFQNLIEVGPSLGNEDWDLKPLENKILDNISWPKLEENGLTLWQKDKKFNTINDFIFALPPITEIGVYNYELDYDYKIPNYSPGDNFIEINDKLNGGLQFYTYIKNEDLDIELSLVEREKSENPETPVLNIYNFKNDLLASYNTKDNKIVAEAKNLPEGVYKVELIYADFFNIKKLKTKQQYLAFINNLNLTNFTNLFSESNDLTFLTYENAGLQTVKVNDQSLVIENVWQQYSLKADPGLKEIEIPKGKIAVTGDGFFSFSQKQYFNPWPVRINQATDLTKENINYIIANYSLPREANGFKIKSIDFDLADKQIVNGKLRFVISIPDLSEGNKGVVLNNLAVSLVRKPLWQEGIINNLINYLLYLHGQFR